MPSTPRTLPAHFAATLARVGDRDVLEDNAGTVSLKTLLHGAASLATALEARGVRKGERIGLYADNGRHWLLVDLAAQLVGAVTVPRGTDTPPDEMAGFLNHAGATRAFVHNDAHGERLQEAVQATGAAPLRDVMSIAHGDSGASSVETLVRATTAESDFQTRARHVAEDDLVTIIYTSGTTGRPKGVSLRQSNFGHQVAVLPGLLDIGPKERFLSILPIWHIFERTVEYVALVSGCRLKFTTRRRLKEDMQSFQPTFFPSVPRIWESVYDGVQKALQSGSPAKRRVFRFAYSVAAARARSWDRARGHVLQTTARRGGAALAEPLVRGWHGLIAATLLPVDRLGHAVVFKKLRAVTGGKMRAAISGGGLMPAHVERFFRTIGIPMLVGYGLTETSPVLTLRREERNVLGTIGTVVPEVDLELRHPDTGTPVAQGDVGVVWTRGPQVMNGYYKDDELTSNVMDDAGWFNTGDLGLLTPAGDLCFRGRQKETIVLRGGENVDPGAVEEAILASPLVAQAIVVGQDQKQLAALVVPDIDVVARELNTIVEGGVEGLVDLPEVLERMRREVRVHTEHLKPFERVHRVAMLPELLTPEAGTLTQTLKPRRHVIVERFGDAIRAAYAS